MPSVAVAPAAYVLSWGEITTEPARETVGKLVLRFTGGTVTAGPATNLSNQTSVPTLDTQKRQLPIGEVMNGKVFVTTQEQLRQQRYKEGIERAFANQQGQITDLAAIVARLEAAEAGVQAATNTANEAKAQIDIANSYIEPVGVLTAASSGTVTIAAHSRIYGDGTRATVNAGSIGGFAQGASVTIYYVDAGRTGGAVSYQGTTAAVSQTGDTHVVGQVAVPLAGSPPVDGGGPTAPGWSLPPGVDPKLIEYELGT